MSIIDPILLVLLFIFGLRGYFKGFFRESFSLLGLFLGCLVAVRYDEPVAVLWADSSRFSLIIVRAVTFVALFFAVYFSFSLMGWLLHRSAKWSFLKAFNRMGGVVLGMGKGTAILALAVFFLESFPLIPQKTRQRIDESYLAFPLSQLAQGLIQVGRSSLFPAEESRRQEREETDYL